MEGFKWSLKAFKQWLSNREGSEKCSQVWKQIDEVILKTIIAAEPDLTHSIHTGKRYLQRREADIRQSFLPSLPLPTRADRPNDV
jgi:hypothetical protein